MANGVWLNKQQLTRLNIGFPHKLTNEGAGWRLEAKAPGTLGTRYADGGEESIEVTAGDYLVADADEMFLFVPSPQT